MMATFSITAPTNIAESVLIVQGNSTNITTQDVISVQSGGTLTPINNTNMSTITYSPNIKFTVEPIDDFAKVKLRPSSGQIYPRTG